MKPQNRFMQGLVVCILLAFFGLALFLPALVPNIEFDPALVQTLLTLTVVGVSYYLGTSSQSAKKDDTIAGLTDPSKPKD
jgi:hypothetical protein